MAQSHVISALIDKRARIAGKIEHLNEEMRRLIIDLDNIDATIHIFDPTIELQDIKTRPVPPRHQAFRGEMSRIVLETLRNAKKPLTSADIAQRVMAERGLDTANKRMVKRIAKRTGACLRHYRAKGTLRSRPGPHRYLLWEIAS